MTGKMSPIEMWSDPARKDAQPKRLRTQVAEIAAHTTVIRSLDLDRRVSATAGQRAARAALGAPRGPRQDDSSVQRPRSQPQRAALTPARAAWRPAGTASTSSSVSACAPALRANTSP